MSVVNVPLSLPFMRFAGTFSLMVSDSIVELKENQRSTVTLLANESKFFVVDLTQHLK